MIRPERRGQAVIPHHKSRPCKMVHRRKLYAAVTSTARHIGRLGDWIAKLVQCSKWPSIASRMLRFVSSSVLPSLAESLSGYFRSRQSTACRRSGTWRANDDRIAAARAAALAASALCPVLPRTSW